MKLKLHWESGNSCTLRSADLLRLLSNGKGEFTSRGKQSKVSKLCQITLAYDIITTKSTTSEKIKKNPNVANLKN
jgi:hypothetical protein